ncbi:DUF551 domain-containing protein [Salmonella enterica]|uniref:DUF551 domain-containing protein n=4 Tax=Salmonella enterica TaxID=28901 RepID=A0A747CHX8_SALER|nr:DUF551 domain-containing protein [Salmonella enterica]EAA8324776.1 DUF551 domain-containing protein [Salmonella enterica subsp. enterica]EBG0480358.1 DUF551 domain-containing protein [Salmonella enterica subsp. enterica serovar Oranienburg]EBZ5861453.1 DUF551 domain-containing protein [Salmonella enterica subsp. enterica serovar Amersfoort]EHC8716474.1 DUF551 domain-containing protein [Salmonella enterica subsp. enterica serovar Infantis]HEC8449350.1 DUF551 domain-containing protein [Salmon
MTTITKEWLQQTIAEFENTRDDIPFGLDDDDAKILKVLKQALASLDAEPVRYLNKFSGTCVTLEQQPNAADDVAVYMPLYAAPPVQETGIYKDMLNIISLLEKNEWAEHCTSTVLGSLLESEITRLVGKEQSAPVIPDGWISCSERMPVIGELNWRTSFPLLVTCEIGVIPAYYGFVRVNGNKHYGFMESLKYGDDSGNHPQTNEYDLISNVTHWMPLPEPPQEVNRG